MCVFLFSNIYISLGVYRTRWNFIRSNW